MQAFEIMTPHPRCIPEFELLRVAAELMVEADVGALPVVDNCEDKHVVGIITDRDILARHYAKGGGRDCRVHEHMTSGDVQVAQPTDDVDSIVERMGQKRIRRMPIVDHSGRLIGIVAQADLARYYGPSHPEAFDQMVERISEPKQLLTHGAAIKPGG